MSFYETIKASSRLYIRFLSNLCKNDLNIVLGRNLFSIANDCFVNLSDLSKMLVKKKQIKYFDVPSELPCMESTGFTRTFKYKNEKFYVEGFDDYVITEMLNM